MINSYRELLRSEFQVRSLRNPTYSMRAFSRDLGLPQARLSGIFTFRQGLSEKKAIEIADLLNLEKKIREIFILMVKSEHARSIEARKLAALQLKALIDPTRNNLDLKQFKNLAEWYYPALLVHLEANIGKTFDVSDLARSWDISIQELESLALHYLKSGLLKLNDDGIIVKVSTNFHVSNDTPNIEIQDFHKKCFSRVTEKMKQIDLKKRQIHNAFLCVQASDIPNIKLKIESFVATLLLNYHNPSGAVPMAYQISLALMPCNTQGKNE